MGVSWSEKSAEWKAMDRGVLLDLERLYADSILAFWKKDINEEKTYVSLSPNLVTFSVELENMEEKGFLRRRFRLEKNFPLNRIALTPSLVAPGFNECPLIDDDERIIYCLQHSSAPVSVKDLLDDAVAWYGCTDAKSICRIKEHVVGEIYRLLNFRMLIIER